MEKGTIVSIKGELMGMVIRKSDYYHGSYEIAFSKPIANAISVAIVHENLLKIIEQPKKNSRKKSPTKSKIINYMTFKKELLHESYFSEDDINDILQWKEEDAQRVWNMIVENTEDFIMDVFGTDFCPFCIYTEGMDDDSCSNCSYGKRHGECDNDNSDWKNYIKPLRTDHYRNEIKEWLVNNI